MTRHAGTFANMRKDTDKAPGMTAKQHASSAVKGDSATSSARDLASCDQEIIHIPGAIQPHGALLAAQGGYLVTHASANLSEILGQSARSALGKPLAEVIGEAACRMLLNVELLGESGLGESECVTKADGRTLNLRAYQSDFHTCVDIEPKRSGSPRGSSISMVKSILKTFNQAQSHTELCELAVRGLKFATGYDRVIAYRFAKDGHGEVIAEARAAQLIPYLGLRYPASDIPLPARRQFLRQRVGAIADASYEPVPLLIHSALDNGEPLDLTHSALRSVSPIHREYMRNMKTAASLTIGLDYGNDLWGMLVCHHRTPLIAGPETRSLADVIGQAVSLLIGRLNNSELSGQRLNRIVTLRALSDHLSAPIPLLEAFAAADADLLSLIGAAGAVVRISGLLLYLGDIPERHMAERALHLLHALAGGKLLAYDDFSLRYPELDECKAKGSGVLLLPLAEKDDAILWFRPELTQTIKWGGNPTEHLTVNPDTARPSPRTSFAVWQEIMRGHAEPWGEVDIAIARELRGVVEAELARRTKAALDHLRNYDSLTGLPSRDLLKTRLAEAAKKAGGSIYLLFLDLDRFKVVNDTMGHAAGDGLLAEVARRLVTAAGPDVMVARLGGDEFVALCDGLDEDAVKKLSEEIRKAIEMPFEILGRVCHISASIGIANRDSLGGLDMIQAADMAMYVAKKRGGNRRTEFSQSLHQRAVLEFELERDLRQAVETNDQLVLRYQPQFRIVAGTFCLSGFEALVRWQHPRHGCVMPSRFIPLAETTGLILPLGDKVLEMALREVQALQCASPKDVIRLAVNVSSSQLAQPSYYPNLVKALRDAAFQPASLCLEITERMLTDSAVSQVLADIRQLGVHVAIDDFGTGYSAISYLYRLPIDIIKLDRNFLTEVDRSAALLQSVVALAHAAKMSVIQEGIETQAQFDAVMAAGADEVQGFLFSHPLSLTDASELAARTSFSDLLPALN